MNTGTTTIDWKAAQEASLLTAWRAIDNVATLQRIIDTDTGADMETRCAIAQAQATIELLLQVVAS